MNADQPRTVDGPFVGYLSTFRRIGCVTLRDTCDTQIVRCDNCRPSRETAYRYSYSLAHDSAFGDNALENRHGMLMVED